MNTVEKLDIAKKLQEFHYFFRAFWDIGHPIVEKFDDLPTAAIEFDTQGHSINLKINTDFWESLNEHSQMFVICHEMSHVILRHGERFIEYYGTEGMQTMNIAADVVIDEMLCRSFGFNRYDLDERIRDRGCWFDTVFKDQKVPEDESTEYYFNLLNKNPSSIPKDLFSIDAHNIISSQDDMDKILQDSGVLGTIDEEFACKIPTGHIGNTRSSCGTGRWHHVIVETKKKKKWETVIKKWENFRKKEDFQEDERWERTSPRYSQIIGKDIHLPSNYNIIDEYKIKDRMDVSFFMDTSGSCIDLKERFFKAAKSLNPKKFNIRLFCFDTSVKETTIASGQIYGGGGTSFSIIENKIQQIMQAENKKYPHAVFLITDGMGNSVTPQHSNRWFWFLSANHKNYIPKDSKVFMLKDYE
jgi:hypothetical protein